jgi:glycosyltransferase involved in cell wall biosynthesis
MTEQYSIGNKKKKIAIVTSCTEDWGGSEELWGKSVPYFIKAGFSVIVYKDVINFKHPEFLKLTELGVKLTQLKPPIIKKTYPQRFCDKLLRICRRIVGSEEFPHQPDPFTQKLMDDQPNMVIISQGINFDGVMYGAWCLQQNIPYVLVSQKAVDFYWPPANDRMNMANVFKNAAQCFFVSKHNLTLTEEQFGMRFSNALVIQNPNKITTIEPYPADGGTLKLACVGRLFILDKGQDILLRVMAKPKWRQRDVSVSFIGNGIDEAGLKGMAALLDLKNVDFRGYAGDMGSIYRQYHAFVQPSRSEGLPLAIVEAMAAGRPVIASKAGGNTEIILEGITGYTGYANEEDFDYAMETAWKNRHNWEAIGLAGAKHISETILPYPEAKFAENVIALINT